MKHVLIVDDNEQGRYLLQTLLLGRGYRVTQTCNGLAALEAARADPPDLIVSDVLMPQMDGFALCRLWMQDAALKRIPFMFYSATYCHSDDVKLALVLGAMRYLIKPMETEALLGEIVDVLEEWAHKASSEAPLPAGGA